MNILKIFIIAASAPLVSGFIRKVKNNIRMRKGPGVFQPYYNLMKLSGKDEVISGATSWIFRAAPVVVFASIASAFILLLMPGNHSCIAGAGDLLTIFFLLALGRFFLALAGLDAGSSFGGMGSSREMFISSFAEPAAFIAVFVLAIGSGSTSLTFAAMPHAARASGMLAGIAFFMITLAETSRIPVDNQETHLELTMIHEAMVLEYSGRPLALIELASHVKQMIFFVIVSWLLLPFAFPAGWGWFEFPAKIGLIAIAVAIIEVSLAKMRLFRAVDYLVFAFFIAALAAVAALAGM